MKFESFETMKPILDKESYSTEIARDCFKAIFDAVYAPILKIVRSETFAFTNSKGDLLKSFQTGRLSYSSTGIVTGNFSAAVSKYLQKLGAKWNRYQKGYAVSWSMLPQEVRDAIEAGRQHEERLHETLISKLDSMTDKIPQINLDIESKVEEVIEKLEKRFHETAVGKITIQTKLTDAMKQKLVEEYVNNSTTYIQGWTDEAVMRLRQRVIGATLVGTRPETLAKEILAEADVTRSRATFVARQEMSLTVSKFRQERYEAEGLDSYRWSTSHDGRVRHDHKDLQGRVFFYSQPPIVDRATGRTANPGEDFNCRCVAIPILNRKARPIAAGRKVS